jgi:hypothetical protein
VPAPAKKPSRTLRPRRPARAKAAAPKLPVPDVMLDARRAADVVRVPARRAVAIDGAGPPDAPAFSAAIGALFGVAYGLKFARKAGGHDFKVGPIEGRWWAEGAREETLEAPRETWRWRIRIAVPDDVKVEEVAAVAKAARARKGGKLFGSAEVLRVFLERIPAARLGRILHVGPYADEPASFARMDAAVAAAGLRRARPHVEVYLSDPRRTTPAKLRTVLLGELEPAGAPGR